MARALGAKVYPGPQKEIGWSPLRLTEAGSRSCLRLLSAGQTAVLRWHGDTFDLPDGAARLAATTTYENQAFTWGKRALALQFHAEVRASDLERWFIGHSCEIAATPGVSVAQLRRDTARWGPILEVEGPKVFDAWLRDLSPARRTQPSRKR